MVYIDPEALKRDIMANGNERKKIEQNKSKSEKQEKSLTDKVPWFAVGIATAELERKLQEEKKRNRELEKTLKDIREELKKKK